MKNKPIKQDDIEKVIEEFYGAVQDDDINQPTEGAYEMAIEIIRLRRTVDKFQKREWDKYINKFSIG